MPGVDWRLYKAQLKKESSLDPGAISPAGAMGLAQFMPGTWTDVSRDLGFEGVSAFSVRHAIDAGAYYMATLRLKWSSPRPEVDRHNLALASYNAGFGNILAAQRLCAGALLYPDIIICLPQVTGRHAKETTNYVPAIWRLYTLQLFGGI